MWGSSISKIPQIQLFEKIQFSPIGSLPNLMEENMNFNKSLTVKKTSLKLVKSYDSLYHEVFCE